MTLKQGAIAVVVLFGLGYATGRYGQPPKIQEKIIEKQVEVKHDDIETTTTTTKSPDGTETTVTKQVDKSTETTKTAEETQVTITNKSGWTFSVGLGYDIKNPSPVYMGSIQKQVLGPLSAGVWGVTNGTVGVSVGISF